MDLELIIFFLRNYVALFLGLGISTAVVYNELKKLHKTSNEKLTFKKYLEDDLAQHLINFGCAFIWILVFDYLVEAFPKVHDWMWVILSVLAGALNSVVVLYFFSASKKKILHIIDQKTNIADNKQN